MKNLFSSKFLVIALVLGIIFLTGCARKAYYSPGISQISPSQAPFRESALYQRLIWPLEGQVVVPFGGKEESISIKGIVIQAREQVKVVAAQDGRVSFVDESLKGYGKTVIIEHPAGFATVYARNSEILVTPGQWVRQGEAIAKAGKIYFEVRKNTRAEDPLRYLTVKTI